MSLFGQRINVSHHLVGSNAAMRRDGTTSPKYTNCIYNWWSFWHGICLSMSIHVQQHKALNFLKKCNVIRFSNGSFPYGISNCDLLNKQQYLTRFNLLQSQAIWEWKQIKKQDICRGISSIQRRATGSSVAP